MEIKGKKLSWLLISLCSFSLFGHAQVEHGFVASAKDTVLIKEFLHNFKESVISHNKEGLSKCFQFPFSYVPCKGRSFPDDILNKVVVTKRNFDDSVYKIFFDLPNKNATTKELWKKEFDFMTVVAPKNKILGFLFSISPETRMLRGCQSTVYFNKVNGRYLITTLDIAE